MSPDLFNGLFEAAGGLVILLLNIRGTYRDKMVRGVNPWAVSFFTSWGIWNCWYYPAIDQWWSFAGAVFLASMNTIWFGQLLYYSWAEKRPASTRVALS